MTDIYRLILDELRERGLGYYRIFPPVYMASIGAHIFNIYNKDNVVYTELGNVVDMRVHILNIAPPGFGKTVWIDTFVRGAYAILRGSGIDVTWMQNITEAGFVGTTRFVETGTILQEGLAFTHAKSIIGMDEFKALTNAMESTHSKNLDPQILSALDTGYIKKNLGSGEISYQTYLTLWAGSQPLRVQTEGGLDRRFVFVIFIPDAEARRYIKLKRRQGRGKRPNLQRLELIRSSIRKLINDLKVIKSIGIPEQFYRLSDELEIPHFEEILYERICIGYELMRRGARRELNIIWEDELESIIRRVMKWKIQAKFGADYGQVIIALKELGGTTNIRDLNRVLRYFGLDTRKIDMLLGDLLRMRIISRHKDVIRLEQDPLA